MSELIPMRDPISVQLVILPSDKWVIYKLMKGFIPVKDHTDVQIVTNDLLQVQV